VVPEPPAPRVAVLISDDSPSYAGVARELPQALGTRGYRMIKLYGNAQWADGVIAEARAFGARQVIAVGLLAANVAKQQTSMPAVFCQVFNYESHDLLGAEMQGVSMLPPFHLQLAEWKTLSPDLKRVGMIIGPGHTDLISEAESAAARHGIELLIATATSDKGTLYLFKRMTAEIDGFWLLPDNRILSPAVIRDIMSYGTQHATQIVVFNDSLLPLGALMSISSDDRDIANQVVALLDQHSAGTPTDDIRPAPLTRVTVQVNADALRKLNLTTAAKTPKHEPDR
jgi:ABC-type uncharacterized transport system substrate-binding protein